MTDDIATRLKNARRHAGFRTAKQFADRLGVPQPTYANHETGARGLTREVLLKYAAALGVTVEWLLTGKGDPGGHGNIDDAPPQNRPIVVIDYVQAGNWTIVSDPISEGDGFETLWTHLDLSSRSFAVYVRGESNAPEYREGDIVIIDPEIAPLPGDMIVAKLDGQDTATFKKYRPRGADANGQPVIELVPLNDDYPTLIIDAAHPGRIVGTMVEHRRLRKRAR